MGSSCIKEIVIIVVYRTGSQEKVSDSSEEQDTVKSYECILTIFANWYSSQVSIHDLLLYMHASLGDDHNWFPFVYRYSVGSCRLRQ